ncbi:hypothetical protein [Desulfonatronum sp. SC1]|uniref:hypothetical protein n=1 Tax=Desulfonatronum sp. SC1 TaxID=2109626 RepID=UPI000D2FE916|nr:hypothetical protein [Desulfonatronum sp. SC1]PTN38042.1 hypothetical protein C6366_04040 [Desulfonatronum sp. SC1]
MTNHLFFRLCLLALFISLAGCSTIQNAWDKTTDAYETYVDPKPEIDLDRRPGLSRSEQLLATQFSLMDQHLEEALRTLAPQDRFPSSDWFGIFLERFPWMTAVLAVDAQGRLLTSRPETPLKSIAVEPLLEREWSMLQRDLQGFVEESPLGPEMIIAGPFFRDGTWQGLIIAHFDPRALMAFATESERLVLLTPEALLWTGVDQNTTREITEAPWENILRDRVHGRRSAETKTFLWLSRPIGALQLIYALALPN